MKVLMITGDRNFKPGNERYELQKSAVDGLAVLYWGRGSWWPALPEGRFDVVTAQDPMLRGIFGFYAANKKRARFNVQVHLDLDKALVWWKHILAKIVLRHADSIRVVSEIAKQQAEKIAARAKISVLPVYVDVDRFRTVAPVPHETKTMLWIGRFEDEKDPLLAIEVFKQIAKTTDAKMIFLGKGSLEPELRNAAAGLPVEFAGWQDPMQFFPTADVVLSTSKHESFGASIIESLAAGVAVVAPDVGVAKEAGANIAERKDLAQEAVRVLQSGQKGELRMNFLSKEEWAKAWRETLE